MVPFNWTVAVQATPRDTTVVREFEAFVRRFASQPGPPIRTEPDFAADLVRDAEHHDLRTAARSLHGRKVFLVGARNDETASLAEHFLPLVEAARTAPGAAVRDTVVTDTYVLPATYMEVFAATARWFRNECSSPNGSP